MIVQYLLVAGLVACIIFWQFLEFIKNESRIERLRTFFAAQAGSIVETNTEGDTIINNNSGSKEFKSTLKDLNSYLLKNKNKSSDYHIIKEIVNRNVQSLEDEVDTMLSTPLYLGLMATILGIAIGVVLFAWNDLLQLLSGENLSSDGIRTLLTDVGIAMIASFVGVLATKTSTSHFNTARVTMLKDKNSFLTWIQTELMPNLTDDMMGAVLKMTSDLNAFNNTFSANTRELRATLKTVSDNYEGQIEILNSIERINVTKIAKANIDIYDKLQGCTDELEKLFYYIANSEEYLAKVKELNDSIGKVEERTKLFEELGCYFKREIEFVKDRQGIMRQHMSGLDSVLQGALSDLGDSVSKGIKDLTLVFQKQNQSVQSLIEDQQVSFAESLDQQHKSINEKISQIDNPFEGWKDAFIEIEQKMKKGIDDITETFNQQNEAIKELLEAQRILLQDSLAKQQTELQDKLKEAPNQLLALSEISKTLVKLNRNLESQNMIQEKITNDYNESRNNNEMINLPKGRFFKLFIPIGITGIFIALLSLIGIMLFDIRL